MMVMDPFLTIHSQLPALHKAAHSFIYSLNVIIGLPLPFPLEKQKKTWGKIFGSFDFLGCRDCCTLEMNRFGAVTMASVRSPKIWMV